MIVITAFAAAPVGDGSTPTYVGLGTISGSAGVGNINPEYPSGIAANDILLLHVHLTDALGDAQITSIPADWTLISHPGLVNGDRAYLYWQRANGSETGPVAIGLTESTDTGVVRGFISAWRGCRADATPYEAATSTSQTLTTAHVGSSIVTLGANRRVVTFFGCSGDPQTGTPTNGWTEEYESSTTSGNDQTASCNSIEKTTAGSVPGCTRTQLGSVRNFSFTLALIPSDSPPSFSVAPTITTDTGFYGEGDVATVSYTHNGSSTSIQWTRDGVDISGETAATHTYVSADVGTTVTARVTATTGPYDTTLTAAGHAIVTPAFSTDHLLLAGDMQSGTDKLLTAGDMQSGTDTILVKERTA